MGLSGGFSKMAEADMFIPSLVTVLGLTCAVPPPATPSTPQPPASEPVSDREARAFAQWMVELAQQVADNFAKPVTPRELLVAGMTELYEAAGQKLPDDVRLQLAKSDGFAGSVRILAEARVALGQADAVLGLRAFVVAANGFSRATDPYCGLMWASGRSIAEAEGGFGLGFQLEGASGLRWLAYMLEINGVWADVLPLGDPRPPVGSKWIVRRVIAGGPASKAGLRRGDLITHFNGIEVTEASHSKLFRQLVSARPQDQLNPADPDLAPGSSRRVLLRVRRAGSTDPLEVAVTRSGYTPESIFGVIPRRDGSWDYMIDKESKIGYVRVGAIEEGADAAFENALGDLASQGVRGLVLDLRWCPGGYVDPTSRLAGALLPPGKVIATVQMRKASGAGPTTYVAEPPPGRREFLDLPVLVLVNAETTGGGEMIAAALQDHGRAVVAGQRTFGKANIMSLVGTRFDSLQFRVSTGYSLRPNGKPRHRNPDSKPTDEWGVKPDNGFEVAGTADLSEWLRLMAERQASRSPADAEAAEFDDPFADPQKMIAVRMLKELLAKK